MKTFINQCFNKHRLWLGAGLSLLTVFSSTNLHAQTKNYATGNVTGDRENVGSILGLDSPGSSGISAPLSIHTNGVLNPFRFFYGNNILNSGTTNPATVTASRLVGLSLLGIDLLDLAGGDAYIQFRYPAAITAKTTSYVKLGTKPTGAGLAIPVGGLLSLGNNSTLVGEIYKNAGNYTLSGNGNQNEGTKLGGTFETKLLVDKDDVWHAAVTPTSTDDYNSVRLKVRIPSDLLGVNVLNKTDATVFNAFTFSSEGLACSNRPAFSDEGNISGLVTLNLAALKLVTLNQIVTNPAGAIDNSTTTYSTFSSGVANAGVASTVSQNIYFDHTAAATDGATINLALSQGLLNLNVLGGGITFKAYKGADHVGTDQTVEGTLLGLNLANIIAVNGFKNINTTFKPGAEFDRVEIVLDGGLVSLGVLSDAVRIYDVQLSASAPALSSTIALEANNSLTVYAGQTLPTITAASPGNNILWYEGTSETPLQAAALSPVNLPVTSIATAGPYTYYAAAQRPGCTNTSAKIPVNITVLPITLATLPSGTLSSAYSFPTPVAASTGRTLSYELASGTLPNGLTLNTTTGVISGTPLQSGTYNFSVKVTDITVPTASFDAGTYPYSITIATNLAIVGGAFPAAIKGQAYSQGLPAGTRATGGVAPYTYAIVPPASGGARVDATQALPSEFTLSAAGILSGTPTTTGTSTFTVRATDSENNTTEDDYTILVDDPLPVTLTVFSASKEGESALLKWSTTAETNSDRFDIERSQNGKQWGVIGTRKSSGESASVKNYNFTDADPLDGENLYRLKMIDLDGTFAYSRIESLNFANSLKASFYPNPVADKLVINVADFGTVKNVKIFDANGRTVYQSLSVPSKEVDVQRLPTGLYVVQLINKNGTVVTRKIIKQ